MTLEPRVRTLALGASLAFAACAQSPAPKTPRTPSPAAGHEGGASAALPPSPGAAVDPQDVRDPSRAPRALVFRAAGFPTLDATPIDARVLDAALAELPATVASTANELTERLALRDVDVLVLPYGSAFPVDAWPRIRAFLAHGGGLTVLGGAPFHEPVRRAGDTWIRGPRQPAFAHDLLIGPAEAIAHGAGARVVALPDTGLAPQLALPKATYALTLRLATKPDLPDEHGSEGPRDAVARPLAHVVDAGGTPRGCPLLEIDHVRGDRAGARWVLAPTDAALDARTVRDAVTRALEGASELRAQPVSATVEPGGTAKIRVQLRRPFPRSGERTGERARVVVKDDRGREIFAGDAELFGAPGSRTATMTVRGKLSPGLHRVDVELSEGPSPRIARTGFWVRDEKLLARGPVLSASRDWLRKDGRAYPFVGTTYMASDVHRKFLFEPNPAAWDADFAAMKRRGIDFVRTGLWTGWSRVMLDPGAVDEGVLDALDAYVLTAAKHGIMVCFTFFAFLPPAFGGENAYLDPRALEGQRELVTAFARRFRGVPWVHWDLINEPSYAAREDLWKTRAVGDAHEAKAFAAWVRARHGGDPAKLRALYRAPGDPLAVPADEDFEQGFVQVGRSPRKVRDFREFTDDVVAGWARDLRAVIRAAGGDVLVTLGQDEGGIHERPTQQRLAESLDYSAVHTWWNNDDLLWDGVVTKVPEKPIVHQETGLMRLEDLDGAPWRDPDVAARLLERKIAYTFAGRGAGVVEWVWNVNPYMPIDEESTIGLHRPDGTAKPELDALTDAAAFVARAAPLLDDFEPDPVVLVVPHARAFLGRKGTIDATRAVVRELAERFGVVPTALSDLRLTAARLRGAKLVVVAGADALDEPAAKALLEASRHGAKLLVTGSIEGDSYGLPAPSLRALGLLVPSRPVAMRERSAWSTSGWVSFEGLLQESARRAERASVASLAGAVWHEPLPLGLARDREPLVRLLGAALDAAGVPTHPHDGGVAARVLVAPRAALVAIVNERPEPALRRVTVFGRAYDVPVRALGGRLLAIERGSGKIAAATAGDPVLPR
jgi:hypothetical protein